MNKSAYTFPVLLAVITAIAFIQPVRGDAPKPLESPIHMTILPVPDEFRSAPATPVLARTAEDTHATTNTPATPVSAQSGANRDDTDADLAQGGRR